jgi:hypothetical protein
MRTLLITRFAVEHTPAQPFMRTLEGGLWFQHRIALFRKICLPSIIGQTTKPDEWLLLISAEINPKLLLELSSHISQHDFISIVLIPDGKHLGTFIASLLKKRDAYRSCTTRLDSDDALLPTYFSALQKLIPRIQNDCLFEPRIGFTANAQKGVITRAAVFNKTLPPFCSFINVSGSDLHAYSFEHDKWPTDTHRMTISSRPYWIQLAHESNISNQFGWGWLVSFVWEINPERISIFLPSFPVVSTPWPQLLKRNTKNAYRAIRTYIAKQ